MTVALDHLLELPTLPEVAQSLTRRLEEEARRRRRFYEEVHEDQKAEFINGEVVMHSPATAQHSQVRQRVETLFGTYVRAHNLGLVLGEKALCVFPRNDYEPDVCFFKPGKAALIGEDTIQFPVPDLVVEILSETTEARDRGVKFFDYEAHGVAEYWIIDPAGKVLEQYLAGADGHYLLALKSGSGEVRSQVITGLVLPIRTLFDEQEHLRFLRELLSV